MQVAAVLSTREHVEDKAHMSSNGRLEAGVWSYLCVEDDIAQEDEQATIQLSLEGQSSPAKHPGTQSHDCHHHDRR